MSLLIEVENNNIRYCSAGSKRKYANEKAANYALHQQMNWGASVCRSYYCSLCKGWHLTSLKRNIGNKKLRDCRRVRRCIDCKGIHGGGGVPLSKIDSGSIESVEEWCALDKSKSKYLFY